MIYLSNRSVKYFLTNRCDMLASMARKNPHAVALGKRGGKATMAKLSSQEREQLARLGGLSGGKARAEALTAERRRQIAKKAAAARWGKKRTS
jgi:hypothetical protein